MSLRDWHQPRSDRGCVRLVGVWMPDAAAGTAPCHGQVGALQTGAGQAPHAPQIYAPASGLLEGVALKLLGHGRWCKVVALQRLSLVAGVGLRGRARARRGGGGSCVGGGQGWGRCLVPRNRGWRAGAASRQDWKGGGQLRPSAGRDQHEAAAAAAAAAALGHCQRRAMHRPWAACVQMACPRTLGCSPPDSQENQPPPPPLLLLLLASLPPMLLLAAPTPRPPPAAAGSPRG